MMKDAADVSDSLFIYVVLNLIRDKLIRIQYNIVDGAGNATYLNTGEFQNQQHVILMKILLFLSVPTVLIIISSSLYTYNSQ